MRWNLIPTLKRLGQREYVVRYSITSEHEGQSCLEHFYAFNENQIQDLVIEKNKKLIEQGSMINIYTIYLHDYITKEL